MPNMSKVVTIDDDANAPRLNEMSNNFIAECMKEKNLMGNKYPQAAILLDDAIEKVMSTGRIPGREMHADVFKQKPMKLTQKVYVPTKQFPKFNFSGKILGPKGNSLRRLQEETMCKIKIKGRNSTRDPEKEEELRASGDPRYAHLNKDLYVEISTIAVPAEAFARVAYALAEIRKYLIPDKNDEVSQSQIQESLADPEYSKKAASFVEKFGAKRASFLKGDRKGSMSILQKLTGNSFDDQKSYDDEDNDKDTYKRQISVRTPAKRRSPSQTSFNYQGHQKRTRESFGGSTSFLKNLK